MADPAPDVAASPHELLTTGERIRWLRGRRRLTRKALAAAVRVSEDALGNYERDDRALPGEVARGLAIALECSTDYLLRLRATPPKVRGKRTVGQAPLWPAAVKASG